MIRSHRNKYVLDKAGEGFMLYDLEDDPHEQNNLIGAPNGVALERELREALLGRLVQAQYSME